MQLSDLSRLADEQDQGRFFDLRDPIQGEPTGIKFKIAGPDSKIAKKARLETEREITKHAKRGGGEVPPQDRARIMDDFYFALTIGWDITEGGQPVPFSRENFQRVLDAGLWIRAQIDFFAGDRSPYFAAAE